MSGLNWNFVQYIWEQEEFDVINRRTKISLHFQFGKKKTMRHAFSYHWRLYVIFNSCIFLIKLLFWFEFQEILFVCLLFLFLNCP